MAFKRLGIEGFGVVELNNVAFRRDGRIEAQYKLDKTVFADKVVENGMVLAVDVKNHAYHLPTAGDPLLVLIYSAEHLDQQLGVQLNKYKNTVDNYLPRGGYLAKGDKFTTNTLGYDDTEYADDDALLEAIGTGTVYGEVGAKGVIELTATKPESGLTFIATKAYTMPDGTPGVQLQVIAD